jgi:hypothetical protein
MPRYENPYRVLSTLPPVDVHRGLEAVADRLSGWLLTLSELASAPLTQQTVRVVAE